MKYSTVSESLQQLRTPCLVTGLKTAKRVARALGEQKQFLRCAKDFDDALGKSLCVPLDGTIARILVVGGLDNPSAAGFTKAADVAALAAIKLPISQAVIAISDVRVKGKSSQWQASIMMQACSHAGYQFRHHKSKPKPLHQLTRIKLHCTDADSKVVRTAVKLGNALDAGLQLAKDLGNEPPNICNPNYLLAQARKLGRGSNVRVSQLDEKKMTELGMGAFMAVSQGSDEPGRMIIIQYSGGKKSEAPYALVGKGITFDTGGISLKPPPGMDEMKFDMCGAASVLGATKAVIEAKLPINLLTIVAAAENMPSGRATRPGDIVKTRSGQTVEILNTDAEGRLVLCDALTHALTFKPKAIVDVATLTGACIVALGSHASGLYANDDDLANQLLAAGENTNDRGWRMPLWDDYQTALNSNFADMANVGGRDAGSVTAACFLSRFVEGVSWAHLDVAGSAFHGGARKGASGRPVPMLFDYLLQQV